MTEPIGNVLQDRTVLVVEDEYLPANDLIRELRRAGASIAGPFATVERALEALSASRPHAAILDIDLRGTPVYPVADALADLGVPFVFMTGHAGEILPDRLASVPRCHKPLRAERAVALLGEHVAAQG